MTDNPVFDDFPALVASFEHWLMDQALPLWAEKGLDRAHGGFFDLVDLKGQSVPGPRRGRVQGRQAWVFALAGTMGWQGPWKEVVRQGLDFILSRRRDDGQLPGLIAADGSILDQTATLYDQTFLLLALSEASKHFPDRPDFTDAAHRIYTTTIAARRNPAGGFR